MGRLRVWNYLYNLVFKSWGQRKVKVRLKDLVFSGNEDDGIFGSAKVRDPQIDITNKVNDGNHRLHALLEKHGPEHEIEINQFMLPYWFVLISAGTVELLKWLFIKAKALYTRMT